MKKVLLTALALLMGTFMYAQQNRVKIPGVTPSKDVKTEAVLSAVKAPANTNSARTTKGDSELTYCNGAFDGSIGVGGGTYMEWAAAFRPSMYTADDNFVTSVDFFAYRAATYTLKIYDGDPAAAVPADLLYTHDYEVAEVEAWVNLPIYSAVVEIDHTKALWVAVGATDPDYPASYSNEVLTSTDCCMMYFQGEWNPITALGSFNIQPWMIVANTTSDEPAVTCDVISTFPYFNDFENFLNEKDCWVSIDNDGDGEDWLTGTAQSGAFNGYNYSTGLVSKSYNYDDEAGVGTDLDADNYLLSPEFELPAGYLVMLSWYAMATGGSNWPDYYEVMIAPNGSTEISDFVSVYSEDGPTSWAQRTADISAYAGTTVRVVFHHQDNAQYWIVIDNLGIETAFDCSSYGFPFAESFENGLDCWGNYDEDGDGYTWQLAAGNTGNGAQSVSWSSATSSLNPDNWLISPEITIPSGLDEVTLAWKVKGASTSYKENYGVYVSTTGDQPDDFTTQLYQGTSPASWTQLTADLNAYIGQTVRVAFRHYDSYDKMNFIIDDVEVYEVEQPEPVECDSITTFPYVNDFENFLDEKDCWIDIDNDGDGYGWFTDTEAYGTGGWGVDGSNCLISQSYENYVGARNADNYLLSPEVVFPANSTVTLSWFELSQDSSYPDWYEVMIAPNGSTEISDFVSIYSGEAASPWTERTADLSAYAGTTVRVVFHHQSSDCYMLGIDNMSITVEGGDPEPTDLAVTPTDLGVRPNGAWMEPVTVEVGGGVYNVTAMEMENDYFTFDGTAVPFTTPASFAVTTGDAAATGLVEGTLSFMYNDSRTVKQFTMTATAYDPVEGDVVETATVVANPVGYTDTPTGVYHNYNLPGEASDGADAVYKLTFASDVMLDANVGAAANGKVALYAEDFNGEAGPMAHNTFSMNKPIQGDTFTEDFENGLNGWTSLDADGDGYGWKLASTMLSSGYGHNGSADFVLSQSYDNTHGVLYPNNYLVSPQKYAICGTSVFSIWACGQDASYCAEHFSIEVSEAGASAADFVTVAEWTIGQRTAKGNDKVRGGSRAQSTWKQYTADLSAYAGKEVWIAVRHFNCSDEYFLDVDDVELSTGSKGEIARGGSSIFSCDFEDFLDDHTGWVSIDADGDNNDWLTGTSEGWSSNLGVESSHCILSRSYKSGTGALHADNYILTPEFELPAGATITLSWMAASQDPQWPDTYEVLVAPNGSTEISDFVLLFTDTPDNSNAYAFLERSLDLSDYAGTTVRVVFRHHDCDQFYIKIDNLSITAEGGDPEPGAGMFVPAGTYYLVAQATESFTTHINATAAPAPEQAVIINPTDGMTNVEVPVAASWTLGNYTKEMQVLVGSQYPPQDVLIDWTSNLTNSVTINDLLPNTTYFMQVNERNDSGVTMGEIIGFTTVLNAPAVLEVATSYLYPGDAAMLSWEMNRSFRGYNVYVDEMKVNEALITESEYAVEGLEYGPHTLNVTAVYDEGESAYSNDIEVEMTGFGHVAGAVYEQDSITPIAGAEVKFIGTDAFGFEQTFTFTSANDGTFTGDVYEGSYIPVVLMDGYQETALDEVNVAYESTVDGLTFIVREFFKAPGSVVAEELENNTVNVYWDWNPATLIEDFEHDGEMPEGWNQVGSYGWEITNNAPYEGTYCIKSSNTNVSSSTGAIEMTVDVPYEAKMSFYVKPSCESNYDKFFFYIDGVEKFNTSGAGSWTKKEYTVEAGTHTYKWAYTKDSSVNSNDDCIYVDYVTLYEKTVPTPPVVGGTTYDFEDGFQGWTSLDADGDGYGWRQASTFLSGVAGHEGSADFVLSQSYDNTYGVLYPDNYLVSPSKLACQAGAQVKLWACGQDASYAAEHFSVEVSTGGATAAEFTTVAEWTIGSKGGRAFKSADNKAAVRGTRDQSEWIEYTANLSAYAGQEVWVAIRHFNVSDMFYLDVDDVTLATGGAKMETADNRSFQSYNVYRKNVLTDEMMPIYSTTDTTYIDAQWSSLPAGVYQWGVSATYEGNRAQANASGVSRPAVPVTDASIDVTGRRPGQSPAYNGTMSNVFRGSTAYVDNTYGYAIPSGLCVMDIDNPLGATLLNANTSLYAGEIVDGVIYGYDSSGNFVTIDPATGAILTSVYVGEGIRELAYDYTTNTMYGSSTSGNTLYTIDLATGAYTAVGTMSNVSAVAGLVCDLNGQLYAMAFTTGDLYMVDKTNASMTYVGNTGRTPAYVQSAAIDYETGVCYWAYSDASNDDLYTVNLATAQASFVCSFVESCGLCFPHAGAPVPPAPVGDGESEITWSNTLEKGMVVAVDVTVVCNNGQSAEGATVKFTNMVEDLIIEGTADAAGIVSFPEFRSGYYTMEIAKAGYATVTTEDVEIFEDKSYNITLNEMIAPAEGLFASATGWVMWDNIGGDIPTPGEGDEFFFDFETGFQGWTSIDADGDGFDWRQASTVLSSVPGHDGSADFVFSQSYDNNFGVLYPDNYIVSPQKYRICGTSEFSIWACGQDASYAAEHFGVAISEGSNTNEADFVTIAQWTIGQKTAKGNDKVRGGSRAQSAWIEYTADLSAYAGKEVWIAVRHFDCYDNYFLDADDFSLSTTGSKDRSALYSIVMLDGVIAGQATGNWFQLDTDNLVEGQEYEVSVASVYATGMSEWKTTTFTYYSCDNFKPGVKNFAGEAEGNDVTLTWTLPGGGGSGDEFAFSFDSDLEGWTNIDADGDGHMWYHSNEAANHSTLAVTSHSGAGHVMGESYCNATWAALTPNDFFVTPQQYNIGASSMLSFWACAQDENYAAEHFGVAISTSGNTSASDFTTIAEWTLTAKTGFKGPRATDGSREGAWYEYTCDLSEYAGQAAWIAIRHFNCSDQFIMCLDDISMVNADGKANRDDEYLQYCTETFAGGVGTGGGEVWWGIKYPAADLAAYAGQSLTQLGIFTDVDGDYGWTYSGDYTAEVYVGSTPTASTLVSAATEYLPGDLAWHDITLTTPVTIDATQDLWLCFHTPDIAYPMSGCDYVGEPNSDFLSLDGSTWEHAGDYGLAYTWMIRGLVSGDAPIEGDFLGAMIFRDGELITPEPVKVQQMVDENVAEGEHEYMARLAFGNPEFGVLDTTWYAMSCPVFATVNVENDCTPVNNLAADYEFDAEGNCTVELTWACADASAESFKVYRDGVFIGETADMVYTDDRTNNPGSYTYGVVAVYAYCESEMVTVDITITDVEENDVVEGIYPNPTTGNLYIKAAAMQQIRVANALGQVMMNETVSGDQTMIDMSAFEAGIYMVSVTTENGTTVKRISVVK
ncbi:MAG: choice-of-anchor J domain-containing protein [Bacteroidales bacterium]|nr:choice-of-anchor J domain-containing protein [Bacteroidales bacterium]